MSSRIITLDTEVLIIAAGGETDLERGKERALQMIEHHAGRGDSIYLPAPAFAESCRSIDEDVLALLRVIPFDARAAILANHLTSPIREAAANAPGPPEGPTRQNLKVDAMILATAEAIGADIFYVGRDSWFAKTEQALRGTAHQLRLEVRQLPAFQPQEQELPMDG